jgi:hypothetical protein
MDYVIAAADVMVHLGLCSVRELRAGNRLFDARPN